MEQIKIDLTKDVGVVEIGQQGENEAVEIQFDVSSWVESYGSGDVFIYHQREGDEAPYLKLLSVDSDNVATWTVDDADTGVVGRGTAQLTYVVGDKVKKTIIFATLTNQSLGEAGEIPDPYEDLLATVRELLAETNTAKSIAQASATAAQASATTAGDAAADSEHYAEVANAVFAVAGDVSFAVGEDGGVSMIFTESEA